MDGLENNDLRIARYLNGEMNADEAELFMYDLNSNDALRKQYEDELLMSALLDDDNENVLHKNSPAWDTKDIVNDLPAISSRFNIKTYSYTAAAVLLIAAIGIFIQLKYSNNNIKKTTIGLQKKILQKDSVATTQPVFQKIDSSGNGLFNQYYTEYTSNNDPVEVSNYYNDYKNKEYKKVIQANKSDYATMGTDHNTTIVSRYMFLYKGLSYLGNNNVADAIKNFEAVVNTSAKNEKLYYDAAWYRALSYLKENQLQKADSALKEIIESASPYQPKAKEIAEKLR